MATIEDDPGTAVACVGRAGVRLGAIAGRRRADTTCTPRGLGARQWRAGRLKRADRPPARQACRLQPLRRPSARLGLPPRLLPTAHVPVNPALPSPPCPVGLAAARAEGGDLPDKRGLHPAGGL